MRPVLPRLKMPLPRPPIWIAGLAMSLAEVMVKPTRSYRDLPDDRIDVWAVGPGLGTAHAARIRDLIVRAERPMVIDADGLNILAEEIDTLKRCRGRRLLTLPNRTRPP